MPHTLRLAVVWTVCLIAAIAVALSMGAQTVGDRWFLVVTGCAWLVPYPLALLGLRFMKRGPITAAAVTSLILGMCAGAVYVVAVRLLPNVQHVLVAMPPTPYFWHAPISMLVSYGAGALCWGAITLDNAGARR